MGRLLAIDFGRKRCGIAVTDPLRIVASPLETVATSKLVDWLKSYLGREEVDGVIVGHPRDSHGEDSESMRWLSPALGQWRKAFPAMRFIMSDERYTSVLAHRAMLDGGLKKTDRQDKATVDRVAAALILNDYLTSAAYRKDFPTEKK